MPLQHIIHLNPHNIIGVWHLREEEEYFTPHLHELVTDKRKFEEITHTKRRTEWLAGRWLVRVLVERMHLKFSGIWTDEFNKPHLTADNATISISHAAPYVAAILNTKDLCGIDIEKIRDKLKPLSNKFLDKEELEMANNDLTNLAVLWGAKEALYKLHGRKSLIFKENLKIENLKMLTGDGSFIGKINIDDEHEVYNIRAGKFDDYVLVHTQ
jgi:4'-phosphopantetheinyl transferase